ncbi:peptidase S8/S53 domain-containing protein [Pseudoscourfieldia marina]
MWSLSVTSVAASECRRRSTLRNLAESSRTSSQFQTSSSSSSGTKGGPIKASSSVSELANIFKEQDVNLQWTGDQVGMSVAQINDDALATKGGSITVEAAKAFAKKKIESLQAAIASNADGISFDFIESDGVAYGAQVPPRATTPNEPDFWRLWGMTKIGVLDDQPNAGEAGAWGTTTGSNSVTVLVIDSGIDYTHPDLMDM